MKALVVGYGSIGKRHVKNLLKNFEIKVIVVTKDNSIKKNQNNRLKFYKSLDECISEKPDFAIISNSTNEHVKIALILAKAGINIFLEKPLSNSMHGIKQLSKITKKNKLITLMGCNLRFNPCIKKIKELIVKKSIGKILSVQVENGSFLPDWHPNEDYSKSYVAKQELGGGVILTCIHELDYLYWFFGNIKEVFSVAGKYSNLKIETEDLASMIIKFKNNIIAEVHLDFLQPPHFRSCKIKGEKGTIEWNSDSNAVRIFDIKKKKWNTILKMKNYNKNIEYNEEIIHFVKSVNDRKITINDLQQGIDVLKIALAAIRSSKTKKITRVR